MCKYKITLALGHAPEAIFSCENWADQGNSGVSLIMEIRGEFPRSKSCTRGTSMTMIDVTEAAKRLGVSKLTIRHYINDGRLTGYRLGPKLIRLDADEVDSLAKPIPTAASE